METAEVWKLVELAKYTEHLLLPKEHRHKWDKCKWYIFTNPYVAGVLEDLHLLQMGGQSRTVQIHLNIFHHSTSVSKNMYNVLVLVKKQCGFQINAQQSYRHYLPWTSITSLAATLLKRIKQYGDSSCMRRNKHKIQNAKDIHFVCVLKTLTAYLTRLQVSFLHFHQRWFLQNQIVPRTSKFSLECCRREKNKNH